MKVIRNLVIKFMIVFQFPLNFAPKNTENTMSHLFFSKESDYTRENTSDNEVFSINIFHHRKKLKHIHVLAADLLHTVLE